MRMPYPFKTPVDLDNPQQPVTVKILVDMPEPRALRVHLANEHGISPDYAPYKSHPPHEVIIDHLTAHMYGQFRERCEHYHVKGEWA